MGLLTCPWDCWRVHGTAACRDVREADDVAEVDGDAVELLRLDVSVHLELFDDLPR